MSLKLWTNDISKAYIGSTEVSKAYLGSTLVYSSTPPNWILNNLVSYYKMDTNGSFPDAHWSNPWTINWASFTVNGKINWGYDFDWVNDYVDLNNNLWLLLDWDFTFSSWVYIDSTISADWFIYDFWNRDIWFIWRNATSEMQFLLFDWTTDAFLNTSVTKNTWVNCIFTRDKVSWMKIYINWVESISNSFTWNANTLTNRSDSIWSRLNSWVWSFYYKWGLDELWLWNKVLTQTEITALYNSWNGLEYWSFTL